MFWQWLLVTHLNARNPLVLVPNRRVHVPPFCNLPGCVLRNARLCAVRLGCVEGHLCYRNCFDFMWLGYHFPLVPPTNMLRVLPCWPYGAIGLLITWIKALSPSISSDQDYFCLRCTQQLIALFGPSGKHISKLTLCLNYLGGVVAYVHVHMLHKASNADSSSYREACDRLRSPDPAGTRRNDDLIITSKRRRFDVTMTLLLRHVSVGMFTVTETDTKMSSKWQYLTFNI